MACWMTLSITVGTPSFRIPPPGFGIITRNTGYGLYVPSSSCRRISAQFFRRNVSVSPMSRPSIPAAPLFWLTCFQALRMFSGSTTLSSSELSCGSEWPSTHGRGVAPLTYSTGFRPVLSARASRLAGSSAVLPVRTAQDSFLNLGSGLRRCPYGSAYLLSLLFGLWSASLVPCLLNRLL